MPYYFYHSLSLLSEPTVFLGHAVCPIILFIFITVFLFILIHFVPPHVLRVPKAEQHKITVLGATSGDTGRYMIRVYSKYTWPI
jgi:predicted permease